ncbi:response regulator [Noviherbaspirillum humi]|nr:response regulator [Noviherbaspirillum humi]
MNSGPGYVLLHPDELREPDLFLVNGSELEALVTLAYLKPTPVRPALLVGKPDLDLPYPIVPYPVQANRLLAALDRLIDARADALSRLDACTMVSVTERRRHGRLDLDLTDPADYIRRRSAPPVLPAMLIVDRNAKFREFLVDILIARQQKLEVDWAADEAAALQAARQKTYSVVLVNTSVPDLDPYRLCWMMKERVTPVRRAVIFLAGKDFDYDSRQARQVGVDGFLGKPVTASHLMQALRKFIPSLR